MICTRFNVLLYEFEYALIGEQIGRMSPLIRLVSSSIEGKIIPVTISSAIFPYPVTFGGTCGNKYLNGTLHLVILKEKDRKCLKLLQMQTN